MKTTLLSIFSLAALFAVGQRKLAADRTTYYNEDGSINWIDSNAYNYNWDMGFLTEHRPVFGIVGDAPVYLWQYERLNVNYTTSLHSGGSSYPLMTGGISTKSYNANGQCISNISGNYREFYTYTTSGKVETYTSEYLDGPDTWEVSEMLTYSYDGLDRIVSIVQYDGWSGYDIGIDSTFYVGSTLDIAMKKYYSSEDGIDFYEEGRSVTVWSSGRPDYVDYFEDDDSDPLTPPVWFVRGNYVYAGNNLTSLNAYLVVNDVPQTDIVSQWTFTYNSANLPLQSSQNGAFGDWRTNYVYDAQNFLTSITDEENSGSGYQVFRQTAFYYVNTSGIEEQVLDLSVYPNPTSEILFLPGTFDEVTVYDLSGNVLIRQKNTSSIEVSRLGSGNYVIQAISDKGLAVTRFVKQ